jgi:glutathione S-transferase
MSANDPDKLHYIRIPNARGGRAEAVRLCYVLAGKPYVDILHAMSEARAVVTARNPFKQFPFVETASGRVVYQSMAIMHHAGQGTPAWPSEPERLTKALEVAIGGYDLYQAFGGFPADDQAAKRRFEERRAPQLINGLGEIYAQTPFAIGETPCFADCIAYEAVAWCVRRNDVSRELFENSASLGAFFKRFEAIPAVGEFMQRQAIARQADNSL